MEQKLIHYEDDVVLNISGEFFGHFQGSKDS